jgi:replicative DNA helicase
MLIAPESIPVARTHIEDVSFFLEKNRKICGRIWGMYDNGIPIDIKTVLESFSRDGELAGDRDWETN